MDLESAARQSFTTGLPCVFVREDHGAGPLEITVHPDGRVCGRPLPKVEDLHVEPASSPAEPPVELEPATAPVPQPRGRWRRR